MALSFSKYLDDETTAVQLDITPLIDIVFLLLIFFMVSTSFINTNSLPVELPSATTSRSQGEEKTLEIVIASDGQLSIEGTLLDIATLRSRLEQHSSDTGVLVRADQKASHGTVVEVLDLAQQLGITSIAVAVSSKNN